MKRSRILAAVILLLGVSSSALTMSGDDNEFAHGKGET